MDFRNQFGIIFGESENRQDIPEQYQEFLPENVEKDKYSCPYSYSPFLIFFNDKVTENKNVDTIYTDRLFQRDSTKHDRLCQKYFGDRGQVWYARDPKKIEAFLCEWIGKKIVLIANIQYVNVSSGYPLWRLDFCYE